MQQTPPIPALAAVPAVAPVPDDVLQQALPPYNVTLIPGDGIGPEVVDATIQILEATGISFIWERQEAGADVIPRYGTPLPEGVLNSVILNRVALKGPIATPVGGGFPSVNVTLRKRLGLYANLRPARTLPGVKTPFSGVDIVVVRENSEDLYSGIEHVVVPGVVESLKIITEVASTRIARYAFDYAKKNGRKKVTAVHKANIMKLSDGLFLECCKRVARENPEIEYTEMIVDNCCMQLVTKPQQFDVMVMENLYGDIVSDLVSGLVGGLGVTGSANIGPDSVVYEPVHGSAPDIAGKGVANPLAAIGCAALLLEHLANCKLQIADCRLQDAAQPISEQSIAEQCQVSAKRIRAAIARVRNAGPYTPDMGGAARTEDVVGAVIKAMCL